MALFETLALTFVTSLAKHMMSEWLGSSWATEVSQDIVELLRDSAIDKTVSKSDKAKMSAIADNIVGEMDQWVKVELGRLDKPEKRLAIEGVARTLALGINGKILVDSRLDSDRLWKHLQENHPNATKSFSGEATALYDRLLRECAPRIVKHASEIPGFSEAFSKTSLDVYDRIEGTLNHEFNKKEVEAREFERRYREAIVRRLDHMELFGLPRMDEITRQQNLSIAYVRLGLGVSGLSKSLPQRESHKQINQKEVGSFKSESSDQDRIEMLFRRGLEFLASFETPMSLKDLNLDLSLDTLRRLTSIQTKLVIRGRAGSGKTTLLQWLAINYCRSGLYTSNQGEDVPFPFLLRMREFVDLDFPAPEDFVRHNAPMLAGQMPRGWAHKVLDEGRGAVLVDGVDELPKRMRNDMQQRLDDLIGTFPRNCYIITSRPEAIAEQRWPEWEAWMKSSRSLRLELLDMSSSQVDELIDNWHHALAASLEDELEKQQALRSAGHLKRQLKRRPELRRLAVNPLLCAMICAVHHERAENLPAERSRLYRDCVDTLLNRRDQGRKIPASADYPSFGETQKERLVESIAYWMIRNGFSDATVEDVDSHFSSLLKRMSVCDDCGSDARRFFVERANLLREPVAGRIDFSHRTLQEYLAGLAAVEDNDFGLLQEHALDDQWRETIIMAVGAARHKERAKFLRDLVAEADSQNDPQTRQQLYLLAVACLEALVELDPDVRKSILDRAANLIPPQSSDETQALAKAGNPAVQLLVQNPDYSCEEAAYCVDTLALVGTDSAMQVIASFNTDNRALVTRAIGRAWNSFDRAEYANSILKLRERIELSQMPESEEINLFKHLKELDLLASDVMDVSALSGLGHLESLFIIAHGMPEVQGISSIGTLTALKRLSISDNSFTDMAFVSHLKNLESLDLNHTKVSDLSPLLGLDRLRHLGLYACPIADMSLVSQLKHLRSLSIDSGKLTSGGTVEALGHIRELSVNSWSGEAGVPSILAPLKELRSLELRGLSQLPELEALADLPKLESLTLAGDNVPLELLPALRNLTSLAVTGLQVTSLERLASWVSLKSLTITYHVLLNLTLIEALSDLEFFDMTGSKVTGFDTLPKLKMLQTLALDSHQAQNLKPFAELPRLNKIIVRGSGRIDRASLAGRNDITIERL